MLESREVRDLTMLLAVLANTRDEISLAGVLRGEVDGVYPHVFGHFAQTQRMIRTDRWKLVHYPKVNRYQLFDLSSDPHELKDLSADPRHRSTVAELRGKLEAYLKQAGDPLTAE